MSLGLGFGADACTPPNRLPSSRLVYVSPSAFSLSPLLLLPFLSPHPPYLSFSAASPSLPSSPLFPLFLSYSNSLLPPIPLHLNVTFVSYTHLPLLLLSESPTASRFRNGPFTPPNYLSAPLPPSPHPSRESCSPLSLLLWLWPSSA